MPPKSAESAPAHAVARGYARRAAAVGATVLAAGLSVLTARLFDGSQPLQVCLEGVPDLQQHTMWRKRLPGHAA